MLLSLLTILAVGCHGSLTKNPNGMQGCFRGPIVNMNIVKFMLEDHEMSKLENNWSFSKNGNLNFCQKWTYYLLGSESQIKGVGMGGGWFALPLCSLFLSVFFFFIPTHEIHIQLRFT
jgi:hypothetical protein